MKLTVGTHNENNLATRTSAPVRFDPIAASEERDELMSIWAAISRIPRTNGGRAEDISGEFDPKRMLAELDSTSPTGRRTNRGEVGNAVPRELPKDLQDRTSSVEEVVVDSNCGKGPVMVLNNIEETTSCASDNDPRKMLAEIKELSSRANDNNPRSMLVELKRMSPSAKFSLSDGEDDDLEALRDKWTNMLSPSANRKPPATGSQHMQISNNSDGDGPTCDKAEAWAKAEEDLNKLIEYTLREEKEHQRTKTNRRLPCRLIVSNIAADANGEDLKNFFNHSQAAM
jgi:hypothetical protein